MRRWVKLTAAAMGTAGIAITVGGVVYTSRSLSELRGALARNGEHATTPVWGDDALIFPWAESRKDWELRKVSLVGHFMGDRFFVRKELQGKPGFLVFKPFITGLVSTPDILLPEEEERISWPRGIVVNVGWIPADQVRNFEEPALGTPVDALPDAAHPSGQQVEEVATGLSFQTLDEGEEPNAELPRPVRIEGYLRRPEQKAWYVGNWQDDRIQQRNYIELRHILRHIALDNLGDAQEYYLDLHWDKPGEETPSLVGPSSAQESVAITEQMTKGSHVYKMRGYLASASLALLTAALIL